MAILQITTDFAGQVGVNPRLVRLLCDDDYATVTTSGYLNGASGMGVTILPTDFVFACYLGGFGSFNPTIVGSNITLNPTPDHGGVSGSFTIGNLVKAESVTGTIQDAGFAASSVILNSVASGQSIAATTSSATPGTIRSVRGLMTGTASVMTSGNLVGVRGEVDCVGASGGFLYGAQGKVISTGTLSGSSWTAGVFGQLDISGATINAGQVAPIWGDYGATSGTLTSQTGLYGIAMTNTTAAVLAGQLYLYGGATNLMLLNTNAGLSGTTYFQAAGTGANSAGAASYAAGTEVLQISVNGTNYWLKAYTSNS